MGALPKMCDFYITDFFFFFLIKGSCDPLGIRESHQRVAGGSRASAGVGGKRSAQAFLHSRGCLWLPFLLAQCQPVFSQSLPFPHLLDEDRDRMSEATWRCDRRGRPAHLMSPKVSSWPWTPPSVLSGQPASLPPPGSVGARCSPACPNFPCKDPRGTRLPFRGKQGGGRQL